jgi:hypothetical protein
VKSEHNRGGVTVESLGAEFDHWSSDERAAFRRRSDAISAIASRFHAIQSGISRQNPGAEEGDRFEIADGERKAARSTIAQLIQKLRDLQLT